MLREIYQSPLDKILLAQKQNRHAGLVSICSAHPIVLEMILQYTPPDKPMLIESTCNQVNQFGGYTGMTPAKFTRFIHRLAAQAQFPFKQILLGGDHLGPNVWKNEPTDIAMPKAMQLVQDYVCAGYSKIHLDTSMKLADDDPSRPLPPEIVARRAAQLAQVAENATSHPERLRYVIGTEVPIPGGATTHENSVPVTKVHDVAETIAIHHAAFRRLGLDAAWERVIAVVVQPGVEFGDDFVFDYDPSKTQPLAHFIDSESMVYEAHSTDYQQRNLLRQMVRDHFAILKVGPALTFAYREGIFALAMMENELIPTAKRSNLLSILDEIMLAHPDYWERYYTGEQSAQQLARRYSYSDRIRYYWQFPQVQSAVQKLFHNLTSTFLPDSLLSQYMPRQYTDVRAGELKKSPLTLLQNKIIKILDDYFFATHTYPQNRNTT